MCVCVSLSSLSFLWGDGQSGMKWHVQSVVRPNVALMSTNWLCLLEALFLHPAVRELSQSALHLCAAARVSFVHFGRDNASSNSKAVDHKTSELAQLYDNMLISDKVCSLHSNDLVKGAILAQTMTTVSALYSIAALCGMGCNFVRVIAAVFRVVEQLLIVLPGPGPPPVAAHEYAHELLAFANLHYEGGARARKQKRRVGPAKSSVISTEESLAKRRFRTAGEALYSLLNGSMWQPHVLFHHCRSPACCNTWSRKVSVVRISRALIEFIFHTPPTSPEIGKWTKIGPTLDRVSIGMGTHGIYAAVFEAAFAATKASRAKSASTGSTLGQLQDLAEQSHDHEFLQETRWSEVRSKRAVKSVAFLTNPRSAVDVWLLSLALEPVRIIMRVLFICCRQDPSCASQKAEHRPALFMFANKHASPVVAMLQYVSTFLSDGSVSRITVLVRLLGCESLADMFRQHMDVVSHCRQLMLVTYTWLHRRNVQEFMAWPWKLAVIADERVPRKHRESIARECHMSCSTCLDPWFTLRFRELGGFKTVDDYFQPAWLQVLTTWAESVWLSTAQIEFRHARQQRLVPTTTACWESFAAQSFNAEIMTVLQNDQERMRLTCAGHESGASDLAGKARRVSVKGISPLQAYHKFCIRRDRRHRGMRFNPCSTEYWTGVKLQWQDLPPDDAVRLSCEAESESSKAEVRASKIERKWLGQVQASRHAGDALVASSASAQSVASRLAADLSEMPVAGMLACPSMARGSQGIFDSFQGPRLMSAERLLFPEADMDASLLPHDPGWQPGPAGPAGHSTRVSKARPATSQAVVERSAGRNDCSKQEVVLQTKYPVPSEQLTQSLLVGGTVSQTLAAWTTLTKSVARGAIEPPGPLISPLCCGTVCARVHTGLVVRYAEHLLQRLERWLKLLKRPQVLLRTEVREGDDLLVQRFDFVGSWLGSTGSYQFRCNFLRCAEELGPCENPQLVLRRLEHARVSLLDQRAASVFQAPFQSEHSLSVFEQLSEKEWISQLLRGTMLEPNIIVRRCDYTELRFDRFLVGSWAAGPELHVTVQTMSGSREASDRGGKRRRCNDDVDWLLPPRTQRDGQHQTKEKSKEEPFCDLEAMLSEIMDEAGVGRLSSAIQSMREDLASSQGDSDAPDSSEGETAEIEVAPPGSEGNIVDLTARVAHGHDDSDDSEPKVRPAVEPVETLHEEPGPDDNRDLDMRGSEQLLRRTLACRRWRCVSSVDRVAALFGLQICDDGRVMDAVHNNSVLGTLKTTFGGSTIQCKCRSHLSCKFLLSVKPALGLSLLEVQCDLMSWLAFGASCTKDKHVSEMQHVKRVHYLMRIRA